VINEAQVLLSIAICLMSDSSLHCLFTVFSTIIMGKTSPTSKVKAVQSCQKAFLRSLTHVSQKPT
jgi:hypothetical protein